RQAIYLPALLLLAISLAGLHACSTTLPTQANSDETTSEFSNGDFEFGHVAPWEEISDAQITTEEAHSGKYSLKITGQYAYQRWIPVVPGKTYVFSAWFKWKEFSGNDWGYATLGVTNYDWSEATAINQLNERYEKDRWNKIAVAFVAKTDAVQLQLGVYGPQENVLMYFDDVEFYEKTGENEAPTVQASASASTGNVPFSVQFSSEADDKDGAIKLYHWDFGDGSVDTAPNPEHTYYRRGSFEAKLTVWDNEELSSTATVKIQVADTINPIVKIQAPSANESYETTDKEIALSGLARAAQDNRTITQLVWDNVSSDDAGIIAIDAAAEVHWQSEMIPLKPGENELLVTATDSEGYVGTSVIYANREVDGPQITNIVASTESVNVYEKYELTFDLETVAKNYFFHFDTDPPPGVEKGSGVTVEGIFKTPSGEVLVQPGFYTTEVEQDGGSTHPHFTQDARKYWSVRFSPQEEGLYEVSLSVEDASGKVEVPVGKFTALPPVRQGFIRVSQADSRYFEFSNGDLYWPIGPANGWDYAKYKDTGQNLERPWMASFGIYSTNFARWVSTAKTMGNEGYDSQLSYKEHYPSHELSQEISYPDAQRFWIGWINEELFGNRFVAGAEYQIKIRLKTVGIEGPVDPSYPYGFMIKRHGWPSETLEEDLRLNPSMIPPIYQDRDWHTVVVRYRATGQDASSPYLGLFLDNVSAGEVYIDELSIRRVLSDGSLGAELVFNPQADLHTYAESLPAAFIDWQVNASEQNGVYQKYVVEDKRDWVPEHLTVEGVFSDNGDGFYQPADTKARWLLEQWWRYVIARWGYSTAIHSWELNNEGSPDEVSHYQMAQDFAQFMHENDAHPHLATTSFWSEWRPNFWGDEEHYPDVDYADIHLYTGEDKEAAYDLSQWQSQLSMEAYASQVGKPVMRGETGIGYPGLDFFWYLEQPNPGIWYHDLLWTQLNEGALFDPNYWWSEHLRWINQGSISKPFYEFVKDLDLNQGGYQGLEAQSDNPEVLFFGQKNVEKGEAHLWIKNGKYTWRNVLQVDHPEAIVPQSGNISFEMKPNTAYTVEFWNTTTGGIYNRQVLQADSTGMLTIAFTQLQSDFAVKISSQK
ncbi:MAG: PKD domain-containing protein, partial [Chloroflexi bacterium]|nr:PKD domain-containing protein [Chloroflexota bacterium]